MAARGDQDRKAFSAAVACNLRRLKAEDGRSTLALDRDCGLASGTVSKLLRGRISPSLITAVRLCDGLGVGLDELVGDADGLLHARDGR